MNIEAYSSDYATEITDLFYQSVHSIDTRIYTEAQKQAWAPLPINYELWAKRLKKSKPYVTRLDGKVAGFIELEHNGHINCCYTHPSYQRKGIATCLYKHLEAEATDRGIKRLYVEASKLAKPFFEQQGFKCIQKNKIYKNGVILENFTQEKDIE